MYKTFPWIAFASSNLSNTKFIEMNTDTPTAASAAAFNPSRGHLSDPFTPVGQNISGILREAQELANDDEHSAKWIKYIKLTSEQFSHILDTCSKQQVHIDRISESLRSPSNFMQVGTSSTLAYFANAKYEEIFSKPIKPPFDGSEDSIIPFLTRLDLHHQNKGWAPATFVKIRNLTYDLTSNFTTIQEDDVLMIA